MFFSIFEITRRVASKTKLVSQDAFDAWESQDTRIQSLRRHFPRTVHGVTLVSGGVVAGLAYEFVSRPFDVARNIVQQGKALHPTIGGSPGSALIQKARQDGMLIFFRNPSGAEKTTSPGSAINRRLYIGLRTLARVGPWGVGFLVWEAFGPGLS